MLSIITINGVDLPHPSSLSVGMQDLDSPDTTRNEQGVLQRDRIRQGVYKVELVFNAKKGHEIALIEQAITGANLSVTFPDSAGRVTREMYVGDRTKDIVLYKNGDFNEMRWNLSFNLVEY